MKQSCRLLLLALLSVSLFSPLESQLFADKAPNSKSYCQASCGTGTPVSTNCADVCSAEDRNCAVNKRGYVQCGTVRTYCAGICIYCGLDGVCRCPVDPDCEPMCDSTPCTDNSQCVGGGFCGVTGLCVCP